MSKEKTKKVENKPRAEDHEFDVHIDLARLNFIEPFYGVMGTYVTARASYDIPTAGVSAPQGDLNLTYNPEWCSKLSIPQRTGLWIHEFDHIIGLHIVERRRSPHHIWNIATDAAINSLIPENRLPGDDCILPGKPATGKAKGNELAELLAKLPKGESSDWYFNKLMQELPEEMKQEGGGWVAEIFGDADCHEGWDDSQEGSDVDEIVKGNIIDIVKKAADHCDKTGNWGSISSEYQDMIRKMISRSVDWRKLLKRFTGYATNVSKSSSIKVINKRYPYQHAGKRKNRGSRVAVYVDQSGSVGNDELALAGGELNNLARKTEFDLLYFDTSVDEKSKFRWKKGRSTKGLARTRCGGTCFDSAIAHFNDNFMKFGWDAMLIITDGEAGKPRACRKRLGWVITPPGNLLFEPNTSETVIKMTWPKDRKAS